MFSNKFTIITAIHQMITDTSYTHKEGFHSVQAFFVHFEAAVTRQGSPHVATLTQS